MHIHETKYRVIYGDTDQMGVVYYGNYARLYEIGRTEMLRSLGLSYKKIEALGVMLPVIKMEVKYKMPAYYDDILCIRTRLKDTPSTRIIFYTEILNSKGLIINEGKTELVFLDSESRKIIRVPDKVLKVLNKII